MLNSESFRACHVLGYTALITLQVFEYWIQSWSLFSRCVYGSQHWVSASSTELFKPFITGEGLRIISSSESQEKPCFRSKRMLMLIVLFFFISYFSYQCSQDLILKFHTSVFRPFRSTDLVSLTIFTSQNVLGMLCFWFHVPWKSYGLPEKLFFIDILLDFGNKFWFIEHTPNILLTFS